MAEVINVTIKGIGDFSDVVSNVSTVQKALTKLKLPDKLGDSLNKNISNFMKEYDKYQKKIAEGIHTQGDKNAVNKSLNSMLNSYEGIIKDFNKLSPKDFKEIFNLDDSAFASVQKRIQEIQAEIKKIKLDPKQLTEPMEKISELTKAKSLFGNGKGFDKLKEAFDVNNLELAKEAIKEIQIYYDRFSSKMSDSKKTIFSEEFDKVKQYVLDADNATQKFAGSLDIAEKELSDIGARGLGELDSVKKKLEETRTAAESITEALKRQHSEEFSFNREAQNIDRQIQSYFGLSQMIRKVGNIAREAFSTVKELDKAMTETAVVTNYSVGDMWNMLPQYTANANALGSTINDVYEATTLFYQQGLNTAQAMGLANETLKMARIAGLDAKDATDAMTAALRGFNMEINQMSAQKINDVYSALAAGTASDVQELSTAMEKTASLAHSAGMDFSVTSALLAQMIETTREAPENLGTAMKTIVARFQEMKQDPTKLIDSEGVAMDANKVDKALKSIGVSLMNTNGEFRNLDEVFLEISAKWDSLTMGQQRYIATMAAGSRQQSRFIAMMSDYERTMELVNMANNSAGASQKQFEKTLDSMEAKLNKLKNAWDQFTMGLMNNEILKTGVDLLTTGFTIVNKFIDAVGSIPTKGFEGITKSILTLVTTLGLLNTGKKLTSGLTTGLFGVFEGKSFTKQFAQGWGIASGKLQRKENIDENTGERTVSYVKVTPQIDGKAVQAEAYQKGVRAGRHFTTGFEQEVNQTQAAAINNTIEAFKIQVEDGDLGQAAARDMIRSMGVPLSQLPEDFQKAFGVKMVEPLKKFGASIQNTGQLLMGFGNTIEGPLGSALSKMGSVLNMTGSALITFSESEFLTTVASDGLSVALKGLWASLTASPLFPIIATLAAVAAGIAAIVYALGENKRALEAAENAANQASDAYDSLKQEVSELKDTIEQINDLEASFDGLVAGSAAFNEKLIESNQLIMDLINKYPELQEFLSVDKNGRMSISNTGLQELEKTQQERLSEASALSVAKNGDLQVLKLQQERERLQYRADEESRKQVALLDTQIKAQQRINELNAARSAIVGTELKDSEKVSAVLADQYETRKAEVKLTSDMTKLKRQYADFYGYNYDVASGKITDISGNEVEVDNQVIKDTVLQMEIIANMRVDAQQLESEISKVNYIFNNAVEAESDTLFSDILTGNIDIEEDLEKITEEQIQDVVENLDAETISIILGVDSEKVESDIDKYKEDLTKYINDQKEEVQDAQEEMVKGLNTMITKAMSSSKTRSGSEAVLKTLTNKQKSLIYNASKQIEQQIGRESANIFISKLSDFYATYVPTPEGPDYTSTVEQLIGQTDWSSAISQLETYNGLLELGDEKINKLVEDLKNASDSSNLLTEAVGEAWDDAFEKVEDYADSTGKLDASAIKEMAKESSALSRLLDSNAISAGGLASVFNALGKDGNLTIFDLNDRVVKLIDSFSQLDNVMASAHNTVENFNAGLDTGEGEDFIKNQVKTWKELFENGEWGNPQLEAITKLVVGEEEWIRRLQENHGDLEATLRSFSSQMNLYSDGFYDSWAELANLQKEVDGISVGWAENGGIEIDFGDKGTEDIINFLMETRQISREAAELMLTDFENYSGDLKARLQSNDFMIGLREGNFFNEGVHSVDGTSIMTSSLIQTIADARGVEYKEIYDEIKTIAEEQSKQINILETRNEDGTLRTDYKELNKELSARVTGKGAETYDWIKNGDIEEAIKTGSEIGIQRSQLDGMVFNAIKEGNQELSYKGHLIEKEDVNSVEELSQKLAEIDELDHWDKIGETLAQGFVNFLKGKDKKSNSIEEQTSKGKKSDKPTNAFTDAGSEKGKTTSNITTNTTINKEEIQRTVKTTAEVDPSIMQASKALEKLEEASHGNIQVDVEAEMKSLLEAEEKLEYLKNNSKVPVEVQDNISQTLSEIQARKNALLQSGNLKLTANATSLNAEITKAFSKLASLAVKAASINLGGALRNLANGLNNKISYSKPSFAGSMAGGFKKGKAGPDGKGGLTLTGEKGFEIAWLPSENRSIILGAGGPQMINLPANAVVYNHEQSKDIMKRKSIPAGSMEPGVATSYGGKGGGGGSTGKNTTTKKTGTSKNKGGDGSTTINNWSIEEVVRFNIDQKIQKVTSQIEKLTDQIDDKLEKIGVTSSSIRGDLNKQITQLKSLATYNDNLAKSYEKQLKAADSSYIETISYKNGKDNKEENINLGNYFSIGSDGVPIINQTAISQAGSKDKQEAIFKATQSLIDNLYGGMTKAQQEAEEARKKIEELGKQVSEAFYQWENEITHLYQVEQKLANNSSLMDRFSSLTEMMLKRVETGIGNTAYAVQKITEATARNTAAMVKNIADSREKITAASEEQERALSYRDEYNRLQNYKKTTKDTGAVKDETIKYYEDQLTAAKLTSSYVKDLKQLQDGSYTYNIDWETFNNDAAAGKINETTYDEIKKRLDNINETTVAYNESITALTENITDLYTAIEEYQSTIAGMEDELISGIEKQVETEIKNNKALSESISKSLKSVLDEVKKKLDERRKKEDNVKTETDISQKQQRLAMLQADTSGGHAVEIAQLQQEIANAQQSYERSLEDQMLAQLQTQADVAAQQRTRQIELAEAQNQIAQQTGVYAQQVAEWLANPSEYEQEIVSTLSVSRGLDEKGVYNQEQIQQEIQKDFAQLAVAVNSLPALEAAAIGDVVKGATANVIAKDTASGGAAKGTSTAASNNAVVNKAQAAAKTTTTTAKPATTTTTTKTTTTATPATHAKGYLYSLPVKDGSLTTEQRKNLERGMNTLIQDKIIPGPQIGVDGQFGNENKRTTKALQKLLGVTQNGSWNKATATAFRKSKWKKYHSGGLATSTGPAWLDGTPAKPELVLNAQDTKNFIALKDILSKAIGSTNAIENSYGGDTTYEININVDHLNNDYDVDKVAERVKKIIVKDSSYRNVTQVRKFR